MNSEERLNRLRYEALTRAVANRPPAPTTTPHLTVQIIDGGNIPKDPDHYFLANPVYITGDVCEGCPATLQADTSTVVVVDVIGEAPVAGDYLDAHLIGGRWVAEKGQGQQQLCGCGWMCTPTVQFTGGDYECIAVGSVTVADGQISGVTLCPDPCPAHGTPVGGWGYTSTPTVTISVPPTPGIRATATATVGGIVSIRINNAGSGYLVPPTVTIAAPGGSGITATATTTINAMGQVTGITLTNPGSLYTVANPMVMLSPPPGGGVQATAVAVALPGQITHVTITNPGSGYVDPLPVPTTLVLSFSLGSFSGIWTLLQVASSSSLPGGLAACQWALATMADLPGGDECGPATVPLDLLVWYNGTAWEIRIVFTPGPGTGLPCGGLFGCFGSTAGPRVNCLAGICYRITPTCAGRPYSFTFSGSGTENSGLTANAAFPLMCGIACGGAYTLSVTLSEP